ncbi:MAG: NlpC/P60 family protein [Lachnobacterium sp.]|nr:NlpC/P60 family protein [Lachnobacterium sp.]MDD6632216.1 NlpC/P60 family protein [Lachnobacterium sp.]MDY2910557.1 NlpC/P60 family protein [Agathobacter sp.]
MKFSKKSKIQVSAILVFALVISVITGISNGSEKNDDDNNTIVAGLAADLSNSTLNTATISAGVTSDLLVSVTSTAPAVVGDSADGTVDASQLNAAEQCGYENIAMSVIGEGNLNIRDSASTEGSIVGKMTNHNACEILGVEGDWTQIESGKVTGYVKSEYIVTGDEALAIAEEEIKTVATVEAGTTTLNVRSEASTDSSILSLVGDGEDLVVSQENDGSGWIQVEVDDEYGYVSADYVAVSKKLPTAKTITEIKYGDGVSDVRVALVQNALQYVGNRYVWGGTSLTNGVDCSGFTMQIMAQYGIYLPHSSRAQPAYGTKISSSEAQPGDLFFYGSGKSINHVAIYIGNGQIVHASNKRDGIKISNAFYRSPICVVRYFN